MGDWIEFAMFLAGIAALFVGLGWAAWSSFPGRRMFALATTVQILVVWFALVIWLAVR